MTSFVLVAATLCSALAVGLVPALIDSLRAPLRERLGLTEGRTERLLAVFYLCWLPGMPAFGWLLDHGAHKEPLFFGLLGLVLGIAWLALARSALNVLGAVTLLGVAYSCVTTATVYLMTASSGLNFHDSPVGALNLGFISVGFGALLGPWVVARIDHLWGYRQGLLALGLSFLVPAALVTFCPREDFPEPRGTENVGHLLLNPQVGLIAFIILLYFAIENCLDVWPQPYLKELGRGPRGVTMQSAIFWGAFLGMRLAMGWLSTPGNEAWLLLLLVLISALALGNLVGAYGASSGTFGFWLVGASYGPLLPGFLALVLAFFPQLPATALGTMLALSALDTLVFRPVVERYARRHDARAVMRVPTVLALVLAAPLLVLVLLRNLP